MSYWVAIKRALSMPPVRAVLYRALVWVAHRVAPPGRLLPAPKMQPPTRLEHDGEMTRPITWEQLRATGAVLVVNQVLHGYGLALAFDVDDDATVTAAYPVRCRYRGFAWEEQAEEYTKLARYLAAHTGDLVEDVEL